MIPGHRRRVNPESLAVRLGPQLIKELEALLEPGMSEMPPFAVRQEIQQRYNINRRHIYDWFHSKGLRVTKEEKRVSLEERGRGVRVQVRYLMFVCVEYTADMISSARSDSALRQTLRLRYLLPAPAQILRIAMNHLWPCL